MQELALTNIKKNKYGESYFEEVNNLTFESLSSKDVLTPHYKQILEEEDGLFIVVGTDSGLLYEFIKQQSEHKDAYFVFIELQELIDKAELANDSSEAWDGRFRVVNANFDFNRLNIDFSGYILRRKVHLIKSLAVMDSIDGGPYNELWNKVEVEYIHFLRSAFNSQSSKIFEEERILNAADNLVPALEIKPLLKGRDAIVLGGGPTLDDSIDWVRENQEHLIIFAAARIAKRLEKEGIVADFFVTVDPFDWSFDNSKSVLSFSEDSILAHSFHAQHKLVSQWNGPSCYMGQKFGWHIEDEKLNIETLGPTVTNSALHLASSLGSKRVLFSGVDFCYARGLTHESGSDEAKLADTVVHKGKAQLEDNAGNMTETGDDFYSAKIAMEGMIQFYLKQFKIEFVNLGLHSAKMNSVSYSPCQEVVLEEQSKAELMTELKIKLTLDSRERFSLVEQTLKELKSQKKRFSKLVKQSSDAIKVVDKLYDTKTSALNEKNAVKIKRFRKKVDALIGKDGDMLTSFQATLFAASFKPIEDENAMTQTEVVEQLKGYFEGVEQVSKHFDEILKRGIDRAQLRKDELKTNSTPSLLFPEWEKWLEFGRAVQWQTWHINELENPEQKILESAIDNFQHEFEKQDHNYLSRVKKKISNVSSLLARANNAYASQNADEITKVIDHVETLDSVEASQKNDFLDLLNAMKLEVLGSQVEAFNLYEPINTPALKHIALKKMLDISMSLEDYEASLIVLERLCGISLDYLIPYADMLKLLGNTVASIEVLKLALAKSPESILIQNKLAQNYYDSGDSVEASSLVDKVLSVDSENKTALHLHEQLI